MQRKVVIIGAGGHARVIADIIKKSNDELIGFLDDNVEIQGKNIFDSKNVIGFIKDCNEIQNNNFEYFFVVGIGDNRVRKTISEKYSNLKWYTAIHPSVVTGTDVEIGEGTVAMAGSVINTGTKVGKHCIINTCASLDHDDIIEDYVHISPGAHLAGKVKVGEGSWICAGVTIVNNVNIGQSVIVGAGATVIDNIRENNVTYVGVPAKRIEKHER